MGASSWDVRSPGGGVQALSTGLPVSRYVSVSVSLTSPAIIEAAINTCLIIGTSPVIDAGERMRSYANISGVAEDFGTDAEEFHAAEAWFSQMPSPDNLMIGRWVDVPTPAILEGGILAPGEQHILDWQDITDGEFAINVGVPPVVPVNITGLDFSADANLNGVASSINTALQLAGVPANVVWNGLQFIWSTTDTGVTASIGFNTAVAGGTGTDISALLKSTAGTADRLIAGQAAETAVSAVATIDSLFSSQFYGVVVPGASDQDQLDIAAYVEACDPPHFFGVTSADTRVLDPLSVDDLASQLNLFGYNKTAVQYSTTNPYAICSFLARILVTRWRGQNTTITLMYKRQPGVRPENISNHQADVLQDKHCNVYTGVANGANIIQYGTAASGEFVDTMVGADALALDIQNSLFNTLYTTNTKVPQTDFGMGILTTAVDAVCALYVRNGYLGPGVWNAPGFGPLEQGDLMALGYFIYAPSVGDQDLADRAARIAPLIQVAAKTAGAIHTTDVLIYVNQ
jgi:hypothetical protein